MRFFFAGSSARAAASISPIEARASEQMTGPSISSATALTAAASPGEAAANYYVLKLMGFPDAKVLM